MLDYPSQLSLEAVKVLIDIVKNRAIAERKVEFGHAAWNVQGYAQKMLLGAPNDLPGSESLSAEALELVTALYSELEEFSTNGEVNAENEAGAIDLAVIMQFITSLLAILQALGIFPKKSE